jgi:hypothetical protein
MLTGLTLALLIPTATLGLSAMAKAQDPSARNLAFFDSATSSTQSRTRTTTH